MFSSPSMISYHPSIHPFPQSLFHPFLQIAAGARLKVHHPHVIRIGLGVQTARIWPRPARSTTHVRVKARPARIGVGTHHRAPGIEPRRHPRVGRQARIDSRPSLVRKDGMVRPHEVATGSGWPQSRRVQVALEVAARRNVEGRRLRPRPPWQSRLGAWTRHFQRVHPARRVLLRQV